MLNEPAWAKFPPALPDEQVAKSWDRIAQMAEDACLITQAYGGVMVIAMPDEQRKAGIRDAVLMAHKRREWGWKGEGTP